MNRKRSFDRFLAISLTVAALVAYFPSLLRAEDDTTNIISGTVVDNGGALFLVGDTGTNNYLEINSAGVLTNVSFGWIGFNTDADNNAVLVTGSGSVWNNDINLAIGHLGSSNTLTIAAGGWVENWHGTIGTVGEDNAVTVTGTDSVWNNLGDVVVGESGSGNTLTIAAGGTVSNASGFIGLSFSNNVVLVTGPGSVWHNSGNLSVGGSTGNTLTIAATGAVDSATGYISGSGNGVTVTGSGSVWNNSGDLHVGYFGASNTLTIADGGAVSNAIGHLGGGSYSDAGNAAAVIVTGSGSVWNNSGDLRIGDSSDGPTISSDNALTIAASGTVNNITGYIGFLGVSSGVGSNAVTVADSGSVWNNSGELFVGWFNSGNTLTITNGGAVANGAGPYGAMIGAGASTNAVVVTGTNSVWNNSGNLYVGNNGSGNELTIADGGAVSNAYGYIGAGAVGSNNVVTVTGSNSVWNNSSDLSVGQDGAGNTLTIADGGTVSNTIGYIGNQSSAHGNTVTVTGSNSVWNNSGDLFVGHDSAGNTLTIAAGGTVNNGASQWGAAVGQYSGASNNAVTVTGPGSVWNSSGELLVGSYGAGNTLTITNGGTVYNTHGRIGEWSGASNNAVLVTGSNSVWNNSGMVLVGINGGVSNTLTIADGGAVNVVNIFWGCSIGGNASSNAVLITGPGSVWNNSGGILVGDGGSANSLTIANGGAMSTAWGTIGQSLGAPFNLGAHSNAVTVTGPDSVWNNTSDLKIGAASVGNSLTVAAGGLLSVGNLQVSAGNWLDVTDQGRVVVEGMVVNAGTVSFTHSVGTFNGVVINSGTWITDPSTNVFSDTFTITSSGHIAASAGDVYTFTNGASSAADFFNGSTQSNAFDTMQAQFLFDSTLSLTQNFYTAGVNLGPGGILRTQQVTAAQFGALGTSNYALGTLEIGGNLGIWDSFPMDGLGSALYVSNLVLGANSLLLIGSNTTVYFVDASFAAGANIVFANYDYTGPAFLAVPEPNVALLWLAGAGTAYGARRHHKRKRSLP